MKNISLRAGRFMALALVITSLGLGSCKKDSTTTVYGNWTQAATYPGEARSEAVSFVINNIAYAGTGRNPNALTTSNVYGNFYALDPSKPGSGWYPVTPMPAAAGVRYGAAAFTINNKGYVCGGYGYLTSAGSTTSTYLSDVWEYTPSSSGGTWQKVASLPTPLSAAVAGSIGNTGLVGCGFDGTNNTNIFYQFDGTNWSTLANTYPGQQRTGAMSFVVNNQFYVVGGTNNNIATTDVYAYSASGGWALKRSLRNVSNSTDSYDYSAVARSLGVGFTVGDKGYVAVGGSTLTTCYEYNASDDTWTLKNPFLGSVRNSAVGFGIGNYGYVGLGYSSATRFNDIWRFAPNETQQ
jgi:N-acetylneuraminic acid mutarotase